MKTEQIINKVNEVTARINSIRTRWPYLNTRPADMSMLLARLSEYRRGIINGAKLLGVEIVCADTKGLTYKVA